MNVTIQEVGWALAQHDTSVYIGNSPRHPEELATRDLHAVAQFLNTCRLLEIPRFARDDVGSYLYCKKKCLPKTNNDYFVTTCHILVGPRPNLLDFICLQESTLKFRVVFRPIQR